MRIVSLFLFLSVSTFASVPLTFDKALNLILEKHIGLETQKEKKEQVEAKNWSSKFSLLPSISLIGSDTLSHDIDATENADKRFYGVSASMNLFRFGADVSAMMASFSENVAQAYLVDDVTLRAEEEGVKSLLSVISNQWIIKSVEQNLKTRDEALKTGRERFKKGLFASQEVDKLAIDQSNVEAQLRDSQTDLLKAKASLRTLMEEDNIQTEWPWKQTMGRLVKNFEKVEKVSITRRPDWKAAIEQEEAAHARKRQLLGLALPSLDVSVNYGRADYRSPASISSSGTEWQGLVTLTIPLFDRFSNLGSYRAAVHAARAAELEKERVRRTALAELETTKETFLISYRSAETRERTLETTRKLYEVNAARFRRGLINANELMLDQDRLFQSEVNAIKGWSEAHINAVRACHAMGQRIAQCF